MAETLKPNASLEVDIQCPVEQVRLLEELLWTLEGTQSVSELYHPDRELDQTELDKPDVIRLHSCAADVLAQVQTLLQENPELLTACQVGTVRHVTEEDWAESWKQYWHPTRISEHLVIRPSWEAYEPQHGERVMVLDPRCAFGTGTHQTTQLMLQGLERLSLALNFSQISVLDVGTGSGILAIYAAMLGCRDVRGIDNDPATVAVAEENARINGTAHAVQFSDTPLEDLCLTPYDLVLVNIIAPVILELWPDLLARLKSGGTLLASGLIEKSVGSIETAMQDSGFADIQRFQQGDWFAVQGIK